MGETIDYSGRDLEAMSWALNYHRWILQKFQPFLGRRVVEVGAGTGSFSELLLESDLESLSLVEPSPKMFAQLTERLSKNSSQIPITTYPSTFRKAAQVIRSAQHPDSIIYVNVLEHIEDDEAELRAVNETLERNGRLFIFVPALSWLFGPFDKQIGHQRRYAKKELTEKCTSAGFTVIQAEYFDFFGIAPWWIKYRLLKSEQLEHSAVKIYDDYVVPIARVIENTVVPPVGKNLILIAEKAQD